MDEEARKIAQGIIKRRIECTTEDLNKFIRQMGDRLMEFGFIGEGSTRSYVIEIIADENLSVAPKRLLEARVSALIRNLEKEYDGLYNRSKLGRIRGGCAGALNRDIGRYETKIDILKSRIERISKELK